MSDGRGWHGDTRGHREAAEKGAAQKKWEKHYRLASLKLEFYRDWEEGSDIDHGARCLYHSAAAGFWGAVAFWLYIFWIIGRTLSRIGGGVAALGRRLVPGGTGDR